MPSVATVTGILATLTLFGGIIIVALKITIFIEMLLKKRMNVTEFISRNGMLLMLIVALTATLGSLYLSDIAGWAPCKLCWIQRIFMYPQVFLLILALWKKDRAIAPYILTLCIIGGMIALYHYGEQLQATFWPDPVDPLAPCGPDGESCARTYTFRYGYITVPMMALTAFILNGIGSVLMMRRTTK